VEELKRQQIPTYGVRPWFMILFGLLGLACLVVGIVGNATDTELGLDDNIWLLSSIALFVASLGSAMVSLLRAISRR